MSDLVVKELKVLNKFENKEEDKYEFGSQVMSILRKYQPSSNGNTTSASTSSGSDSSISRLNNILKNLSKSLDWT